MKILATLSSKRVGGLFGFPHIVRAEPVQGVSCGLAENCSGLLCANVYFHSPCPLGLTNVLQYQMLEISG